MRMTTKLGRRTSALAFAGALALTGVACGDDDGDTGTDTDTTTDDSTDEMTDEPTDGTETET